MKEAPLFIAGYDFYLWLLDRLEGCERFSPLKSALLDHARALLEALTLALQGFDRDERVLEADEALALLRLHLRLAEEKELLDEGQYRHALDCLENLGRQLGGWRKKLMEL